MKYIVNVGGFVRTYREENIFVEAANKAKVLFLIYQNEEQAENVWDKCVMHDIKEIE